jgi:hypothetical protein
MIRHIDAVALAELNEAVEIVRIRKLDADIGEDRLQGLLDGLLRMEANDRVRRALHRQQRPRSELIVAGQPKQNAGHVVCG